MLDTLPEAVSLNRTFYCIRVNIEEWPIDQRIIRIFLSLRGYDMFNRSMSCMLPVRFLCF